MRRPERCIKTRELTARAIIINSLLSTKRHRGGSGAAWGGGYWQLDFVEEKNKMARVEEGGQDSLLTRTAEWCQLSPLLRKVTPHSQRGRKTEGVAGGEAARKSV